MITEKDISKKLGKTIKSPIRVGSVDDFGIEKDDFLSFFRPFFDELEEDHYLVRGKQIAYLKKLFVNETQALDQIHQSYFQGDKTIEVLQSWIDKLNDQQRQEFDHLSMITRKRNISSFLIEVWDDTLFVERTGQQGFEQNVGDFRGWRRVFAQAAPAAVENELFFTLIRKISKIVLSLHPKARKLQVTSHFMRTLTKEKIKGENAPEGVHEDGAQYIMSALVINRQNVIGGKTQVYEKTTTKNELIFSKVLEPGDFVFQADTGEEFTFGNDLWHYVTPIQPKDISQSGIRDIIGFDIDVLD